MGADISGTSGSPAQAASPASSPASPPAQQGEILPPAELIKDSSIATFAQDVMEASANVPVIVDFWATWCGPCKQLTPILEQAITARAGQVLLVKVDVDKNQQLASQLGIQSMPTVMAFINGQPVDGFMGAQPASEVEAFLDRVIKMAPAGGSQQAQLAAQIEAGLEVAAQAVTEGDMPRAMSIYSQILEQEPHNETALIAIAKMHLDADDLEKAKSILEMLSSIDDAAKPSTELAALRKTIELAEQAASLGDEAEFITKLDANPDDHQTRADLAIQLNAKGQREEAAQCLLDIMARDRSWNEDGAKAQLLEFFAAWGDADPATIQARRKLSIILFS